MAASRGRGIDYHQPEFRRLGAARTQHEILTAARAALKQTRRPIDTPRRATATGTVATIAECAGSGPGIRAWGCARADA